MRASPPCPDSRLSLFPRLEVGASARARARDPPPCRSASRAGTRAPSPGRAGRRPPAGDSAAAAVAGTPSARGGPGRAAAAGTAQPGAACSAAALGPANSQSGSYWRVGWGGAGRGPDVRGILSEPRVSGRCSGANPEPGSILPPSSPCASWDLLTGSRVPRSPTGETEAQRTRGGAPLQRGRPQESVWGTSEA